MRGSDPLGDSRAGDPPSVPDPGANTMPTQVQELGPCKRKLAISIPAAAIQQALKNVWANAQRNVQMKGFRPGKVPRSIIEKQYGKAIQDDLKQQLINDAYRAALKEHDLNPIAAPEIDTDQLVVDPQKELSFELTVEIRPEFEVANYKGITVGAPPANVTDDDVAREIEKLRGRRAKVEPITEGVATKGDYLIADVSYQIDGAVVVHHEGVIVDTHRDVIDDVEAGGGTAAFAGKAVGATVTVPVVLPAEFEPAGFAGAKANLLCSVKEIRRVALPALDETFARELGADGVEDLKTKLRADYQRHVESQRNRYIEERVFDELIRSVPFDLPQDLLDRATGDSVHRLEHQMIDGGMAEAEAKANAQSQRERIRQDQARSLRISFIIDKIARAEKLAAADEELESAIRSLAVAHNRTAQQVYDELYESNNLPALRAQILEAKVRKLLRESAKVSDATT